MFLHERDYVLYSPHFLMFGRDSKGNGKVAIPQRQQRMSLLALRDGKDTIEL